VQYGLKQFDLVFIFKDFTKAPLHINSIQSTQMDDVKNWLECVPRPCVLEVPYSFGSSSVDIPMSEGPVNLNWGPIMKHINESPFEFFQQGGWTFLGGAGGVEVTSYPFCLANLIADHNSRASTPPLPDQSPSLKLIPKTSPKA